MAVEQALVLGGGGVAGIAWMTGLLAGLAESGQDVTGGTDLVIGTSAGANVAAQLGSGLSLAALFARQVDPALQARELMAEIDWAKFAAEFEPLLAGAGTPAEQLRRFGQFALNAATVPEPERRAVIESRLPSHDWPATLTRLIAVDCLSGELAVFDDSAEVSLVDAVAASSAVPGIWPPATIGGRRYMDGGVRSADNADLAAGAARVIVISPLGLDSPLPAMLPLRAAVTSLTNQGAVVTVVSPDAASAAAIGANALDPATRGPAAAAGRAQGLGGLPAAF
ncbi:MAG TPA: patatin-like phospholipase family protein [Trebonia sp.]|jgi:NTE family protein|nr:patatin-like phospholipase family protein [Trebonia sp.]